MEEAKPDQKTTPKPLAELEFKNLGEPITLSEVKLSGVAAEAGREGDVVKVWSRLALTSDAPLFHRIMQGLASAIEHCARKDGTSAKLDSAHTVLLIIHADDTAELWVDSAAVVISAMVKRDVRAGSLIFESDIADVTAMTFPHVTIGTEDRVFCVFREGWRFGLAFDFNPDKQLDLDKFQTTLGTLYRTLRYREIYDAITNDVIFPTLVAQGWFPFVEILTSDFSELIRHTEAGFDLTQAEERLLSKFDKARLDRMLARWLSKPHFAAKEQLLRTALDSFDAREPISVLKIVLTEIEGILADAYNKKHGTRPKLEKLLRFAAESAAAKSGADDTLLLPSAFATYVHDYTFKSFDPSNSKGSAGWRHAVGHGSAPQETYTLVRALQAILTLDQFAFYT